MRKMSLLALALVALFGAAACQNPKAGSFEQPFELHVGQLARFPNSDLQMLFRRVVSDSRCPLNVQCIQAGEAVVEIQARRGTGAFESAELHLPAGEIPSDSVAWREIAGHRVQILELEPYPAAGTTRDTSEIEVRLRVERI